MKPQAARSGTTSLTPAEQQMLDDLNWAASAAEVLQHAGKFVVIDHRRVVTVGTDRQTVVEEAAAHVGRPWWELAVAEVPGDDLLDVSD